MYIYYWYNRITRKWMVGEARLSAAFCSRPNESLMLIPGTVDPRD